MDPTSPAVHPPHPAYRRALLRGRLEALCPDPAFREAVYQTVARSLTFAERAPEGPGGRPGEGRVRELLAYCDKVEETAAGEPRLRESAYAHYAVENGVAALTSAYWQPIHIALTRAPVAADRRLVLPLLPRQPAAEQPCVTQVQFLPREGAVHAVLTFRSSAAAGELALDLLFWGERLRRLALPVGLRPGVLYFTAASLHLHVAGDADLPLRKICPELFP